MHRRELIKRGLGLAAAPFLSLAGTGVARSDPAREGASWTLGWRSVEPDALQPIQLSVEGRLPTAVRGTLFRNGPAKHERAGVRYRHWFDGDGMIQRFRLSGDAIVHDGRFVQTQKYREEQAAGRFLYSGAGTALPDGRPGRNNDSGNVANTALLPLGDELLALWEGGSAYRLDPTTLETLGRKDWGDELIHMPFSAHPLRDTDGTVWNFGSAPWLGDTGTLVLWRIAADGTVAAVQLIQSLVPGYLHSFTMTARHLVFFMGPHLYRPGAATFVDSFVWQPDVGSRVLVVDKNDLTSQRWFEAPAGFSFHCANAYQVGDDIVAHLCLSADPGIMQQGMFELVAAGADGPAAYPTYARARLAQLRLSLSGGSATLEATDELLEFPGFDRRFGYAPTAIYGVGHRDSTAPTFSDSLVRIDPDNGRSDRFTFPRHHIVEEPLFVAGTGGGNGWLVGTFLDFGREQSGVYVMDAANLAGGPVALARMDRALPLGFHGCFWPTVG